MKLKESLGQCVHFDHITFYVSNARQAAYYYCVSFGFTPIGYKGLETGSRDVAAHVIRLGHITLVFMSTLTSSSNDVSSDIAIHGDFVKDIAFTVDNLDLVMSTLEQRGGQVVKPIWSDRDDNGTVRMATVRSIGTKSVTHTLVERSLFTGPFLPGYQVSNLIPSPIYTSLPLTHLQFIDHVVCTQQENMLSPVTQLYEDTMSFHRFWSVDNDVNIVTNTSSLKFSVVANESETIKFTLLEPTQVDGGKKSQVQEFNEYNGSPGIQHIALHTEDIITTVTSMKSRGVMFLHVPDNYYDTLRDKLSRSKVKVTEDIDRLQELNILLDYDDHGYLLQLFTKPVQDRPTLFFEVIQRRNHNGFGAGNFTALFEAVEKEQQLRGNLS